MSHKYLANVCCVAVCVLFSLFPGIATAECTEGNTMRCTRPNGCKGERTCDNGSFGSCECNPNSFPCTAACGRPSWTHPVTQACLNLSETCNNCDDNGNGQVDENLTCSTALPFVSRCVPGSIVAALGTSQLPANNNTAAGFGGRRAYANNISYTQNIVTNSLVKSVTLRFPVVGLDTKDLLKFKNLSTGALDTVTSTIGMVTRTYMHPGGAPGVVESTFVTDSNLGQSIGWAVDDVTVSCGGTAATTPVTLIEDQDTLALLTTGDDAVFFRIPNPAAAVSIWITSPSGGAFDADLYAGIGSIPSRLAKLNSKTAGKSDEFVHVPAAPAGQDVFIVVHSASGVGQATVRYARVKPQWVFDQSNPIRVGVRFAATAAEMDKIELMVRNGMRFFFGMTEGKVQVRNIDLYNNVGWDLFACGGAFCHVAVDGDTGRAYCDPSGTAVVFKEEWKSLSSTGNFEWLGGQVVAHEWGHCLLGLGDEYKDHGGPKDACLHGDDLCNSAMSDQSKNFNLCNSLDHARDPGGSPSRAFHVCANCSATNCNGGCNACFMGPITQWGKILSTGAIYSEPPLTSNFSSYRNFSGFPFNIVRR